VSPEEYGQKTGRQYYAIGQSCPKHDAYFLFKVLGLGRKIAFIFPVVISNEAVVILK